MTIYISTLLSLLSFDMGQSSSTMEMERDVTQNRINKNWLFPRRRPIVLSGKHRNPRIRPWSISSVLLSFTQDADGVQPDRAKVS